MKRHAFTVVELLVVIAIIGVLVALLMPAVQMARESARRTQCTNNLSQLANGVTGYASTKGHLPASRTYDPKSGTVLSWVVPILPEIDQQGLSSDIRDGVPIPATRIPILMCPSFPSHTSPYPQSYGANGGAANSVAVDRNFDWSANGVFVDLAHVGNPAFSFPHPLPVGPPLHPMLCFEQKQSIENIAKYDGTSNTLMLIENCLLDNWLNAPQEQHAEVLWFSDGPAGFGPGSLKDASFTPYTSTDLTANVRLARPASLHPGGFMAAMCDGSVRHVSTDVNYQVYAVLMTQNGYRANDPTDLAYPMESVRTGLAEHADASPVWQSPTVWNTSTNPPVRIPNPAYPGSEF